MKMISNFANKITSVGTTTKWAFIVALICAGVSTAIVAGIIFLYVFAAAAHVVDAINLARALLWRG